ncbi:MAG: YidC/Oxa1 family insertase periplasmic-domain containing protein [Xanthobacteraceae bacterium]
MRPRLSSNISLENSVSARPPTRLFAGAKKVETVDGYDWQYGRNCFELLIDWGWFYMARRSSCGIM